MHRGAYEGLHVGLSTGVCMGKRKYVKLLFLQKSMYRNTYGVVVMLQLMLRMHNHVVYLSQHKLYAIHGIASFARGH